MDLLLSFDQPWILFAKVLVTAPILVLCAIIVRNVLRSEQYLGHLHGPKWNTKYTGLLKRLLLGHDDLIHHVSVQEYGQVINSFADQFGPVFKTRYMLGSHVVHLTSPAAAEHVLSRNARNYIKPNIMRMSVMNVLGGDGIFLSEGATHRRLRKIVAPAFHHKSLLKLSSILFEEAIDLVDSWKEQLEQSRRPGEESKDPEIPIKLDDEMGIQALKVILRAAFGHRMEDVEELYHAIYTHFADTPPLWRLLVGAVLPSTRFDKYVAWGYRELNVLRNTVNNIVQQRRKELMINDSNATDSNDLLALLMQAHQHDQSLNDKELVDQVTTFLTAGSLTTAMTMSWCIYNLARYPAWQEKLYHEICTVHRDGTLQYLRRAKRTLNGKGPRMKYDMTELDALPLLDAFVRETLRLHSPVTNLVRTSVKDDTILGRPIPRGTQVRIPITGLHLSHHFDPSPTKFDPSRWTSSDSTLSGSTRKTWIPFIYGSNHSCIGKNLALYEIKVHLVVLLLNFKFSPTPNGDPESPVGFLYKFKKGKVSMKRRKIE